jgi:putative membrane protein
MTDDGSPDPRYSLANERTFLAWVRTSLAFVAFGVAIPAVMRGVWSLTAIKVWAAALLLAAAALTAGATIRWRRVEHAMRRGEPVPASYLAPVLLAVVLLAIAVAVVAVLQLP